ncbi:alkaline phosphatase family protein [Novosphingobium lentum]|uniref:alkaline phosphatase family protein n=1 Tax=Novosphingobium lentum TaxID=145287 RepID=UPI000835DF5B|nr:alkaline phosphatase family protein [Novosphingobium lentum]
MILRKRAMLLAAPVAAAASMLFLAPAMAKSATRPASHPASAPSAATPHGAPRLVVAIAIDQFSADLFAQYRTHFTGGFARLLTGAVFPAGYQSHAATETCPGHSTILTGDHPARTGIIANNWFDQSVARAKKSVYCAEDETRAAADPKDYVASVGHLLVPTLGERMKQANPASRNIAVSGKDRAALMMGGHNIDQVYWWKSNAFTTLDGKVLGPTAVAENAVIAKQLGAGSPGYPVPGWCGAFDRPVVANGVTVGNTHLPMAKGDATSYRVSPRLDRATLELATRLVDEQKLGQGTAPDLLAVSLSATDYIGHATGTEGAEMCIQLTQLDLALGDFFTQLDKRGVDYLVVLTADHGGFDLPERLDQQALPIAARADAALVPDALGKAIATRLGMATTAPLLLAEGPAGDYWIDRTLTPAQKHDVIVEAKRELAAQPQVAAVLSAEELAAEPMPTGSPETWSLIQRARASYYAPRSGDFVVLLKRGIVPIPQARPGYVATHGSPWDYDRRVPMLFWRKGMAGFEQPSAVETVDIAPTLAAQIGLPVVAGSFDGRCLDLDAGAEDSCKGS